MPVHSRTRAPGGALPFISLEGFVSTCSPVLGASPLVPACALKASSRCLIFASDACSFCLMPLAAASSFCLMLLAAASSACFAFFAAACSRFFAFAVAAASIFLAFSFAASSRFLFSIPASSSLSLVSSAASCFFSAASSLRSACAALASAAFEPCAAPPPQPTSKLDATMTIRHGSAFRRSVDLSTDHLLTMAAAPPRGQASSRSPRAQAAHPVAPRACCVELHRNVCYCPPAPRPLVLKAYCCEHKRNH
jgi:hypothetical protein